MCALKEFTAVALKVQVPFVIELQETVQSKK
jgi:hypothetical protein